MEYPNIRIFSKLNRCTDLGPLKLEVYATAAKSLSWNYKNNDSAWICLIYITDGFSNHQCFISNISFERISFNGICLILLNLMKFCVDSTCNSYDVIHLFVSSSWYVAILSIGEQHWFYNAAFDPILVFQLRYSWDEIKSHQMRSFNYNFL